ncbi:nuclear transport factor 2 family protein [Nocardia gipuzkoensis]|uniref:nuclear transport factor 2 family protein n=1 Tax=Nocardia gipuzkoensis TaxID=2749991 RepID=UPI0015EF5D24|nr:nuclear transport factor 2 family protein [Nocardia gipuzkoensis]
MERHEVEALLDAYYKGVSNQSVGEIPLADDVSFVGPRMGPFNGEEAVRAMLEQVSMLFTAFTITRGRHVVDGDTAVLFLDFSLPDGRHFELADVFTLRDGAFASIRPYFDPGLLQDLGMAGAPRETTN